GDRWSAEEERLLRVWESLTPLRDAALEIEDEEVRFRGGLRHARIDKLRPRVRHETLTHAATQHRVSGEGERDGHGDTIPDMYRIPSPGASTVVALLTAAAMAGCGGGSSFTSKADSVCKNTTVKLQKVPRPK